MLWIKHILSAHMAYLMTVSFTNIHYLLTKIKFFTGISHSNQDLAALTE